MVAFGITLYYTTAEATITVPANIDFTPAATNLGWVIGSNTTTSNIIFMNGQVPTTHTNRLEIAPFDENLSGSVVPMTPTLMFRATFTKTPGNPLSGGEVYLGGSDTDGSIQYVDADLNGWSIIPTGDRTQVLPLHLVNFEAKKDGDRSTYLNWSTVNEINTSHFMVQRSTDKKAWETIGKVDAAGNSQLVENYDFMDHNVYNGIDSRLSVYYRLQMVDLDGQQKNSPIENVIFGKEGSKSSQLSLLVYPNPATDGVQVEWNGQNSVQPTLLELYDITGKLVLTQKVSDNANQEYIDFGPAKMTSGLYLLRILNGSEPIEHKQIVVGQDK